MRFLSGWLRAAMARTGQAIFKLKRSSRALTAVLPDAFYTALQSALTTVT
ncbi:MAG: hypothetical protein Hals2KO_22930 [Halioglobus sp.]